MSQWGSSDSGILRKNRVDDNLDQLLVFGYSCKIFRDDEKALYIDQGKHLIPWMGNESLKIDRYDGRGTLSDIKTYEASREGYDTLRWLGLSESEKKLEELCDRERYYSLEINEEEEEMYKEEVAKRTRTNAIAFDYNATLQPPPEAEQQTEGIPTVPEKEEEDEPYKPSPTLDVPVDIDIPKTMKEYARIEKTALFVSRQGPQMEILIKAKQADNPQFSFLTVHDTLYKFYRHILSAFKNGRYQPQCEKKPELSKQDTSETEDQSSHYLHPSLVSASVKPCTPPVNTPTTLPYRPSADCAYSQLVNRIQGAGISGNGHQDGQSAVAGQQQAPSQMQLFNHMNLEQQYHQYYYVQQFYEYWRHSVVNSEQGALYSGLPMNFSQLDSNMQSYIHQLAWAQFVQHHQKQQQEAQQQQQQQQQQQIQASSNNNSYAQIVHNVNKDGVNPYTANVPLLPPIKEEPPKAVESVDKRSSEDKKITLVKYDANEVKKPLLSLAAAYGSGSDEEDESEQEEIETPQPEPKPVKIPPIEMQTVVDKMAEYVMKNGETFEEIIKQKDDSRFCFLKPDHEFYAYYKQKLGQLRRNSEEKKPEEKKTVQVKASKKIIAPVSFSIKKPKDDHQKEIKSALPVEDSSDEEPGNSPQNNTKGGNVAAVPSSPQVVAKPEAATPSNTLSEELLKNKEIRAKSSQIVAVELEKPRNDSKVDKPRSRSRTKSPTPTEKRKSRSKTPVKTNGTPPRHRHKKKSPPIDMFDTGDDAKLKNGVLEKDDPILEMLQLEKDQNVEISADDRKMDEKEKARRLERKRKAAMFLKLKSAVKSPSVERKQRLSPSPSRSRRSSDDSVIIVRSRSTSREKSRTKEKSPSRDQSASRSSRRSRSKERRKRRSKKERERSDSKDRHEDRKRKKDKKKKSHKRKRSKSKKKSKKHKRSRSSSKPRRSRSRSSSAKSHISINSS